MQSTGDRFAQRWLLVATVALLCTASAQAQSGYGRAGVTLFEDIDFRGYEEIFTEDIDNLNATRFGNNEASSIRVDRGCRVTLYSDTRFRGRSITLRDDERNLGRTEIGNDSVGSLRVDCGRGGYGGGGYGGGGYGGGGYGNDDDWDDTRGGVVLFEDEDFRGERESFDDDDRNLRDNRIGNDRVRSIRVQRGCEVTLYADSDFRGRSEVLNRDVPSLNDTRIGNDTLSSLKVTCRGFTEEGVVLYSDADFRGRSEVFTRNDGDLRNNNIRNDAASSVRIARGCQATLYSDTDFRGTAEVITYDIPNLYETRIGNDRVSSIEVSCNRGLDWDGKRGAVLFSDEDFRGRNEVILEDDRDLRNNPIRNDAVSSVKVAPGCKATLFRDTDFRGGATVLTSDAPSLSNSRVGNDGASSIRVECGYYGNGGGPDLDDDFRGVRLFRDVDFRGSSEVFTENARNLQSSRIGNDTVSSVQVSRGCQAILYSDRGFFGRSVVITEDTPNLDRTRLGNDTASSIEVECDRGRGGGVVIRPSDPRTKPGTPPEVRKGVVVYSGESYRGESEVFLRDDGNLRDNDIRFIRSIRLSRGCRAMLYSEPRFGGKSILVRKDVPSLRQTAFGGQGVASIEVDCRGRR